MFHRRLEANCVRHDICASNAGICYSCLSDSNSMAAAKHSRKAKKPAAKVSDARVRKGRIKPSDLKDLKKLSHIASLLEPLHKIGAARDKAGNRSLHMDERSCSGAVPHALP